MASSLFSIPSVSLILVLSLSTSTSEDPTHVLHHYQQLH